MKQFTLYLTGILILAVLLTSCSAAPTLLSDGAGKILDSAVVDSIEEGLNITDNETDVAAQPTVEPPPPISEVSDLLAAYEGALENVYEYVNPSVVNIQVVQRSPGTNMEAPGSPDFPFDIPGLPNLPEIPNLPEGQPYSQGLGSGFVWDDEGHIVTNNHVVGDADEIEVTFHDGTTLSAELVGTDPDSDLAVIKVDMPAGQLRSVSVGDSRELKVGQLAIAIGNPFGLEGTMTVGIISALGRTMPANMGLQVGPSYSIPDVIQTDAPINPGNSGGVLVDDQGQVMGVTFAIESTSGANAGIGFVIPSTIVKRVIPSLVENGYYDHPYLGISGVSMSPDLAEAMDLDTTQRGALIVEVSSNGPAEKAGLLGSDELAEIDGQQVNVGGDVIIAANGEPINGMDDLIAYLSNNTSVDDEIVVTVLRDGRETGVEVTLEARPKQTEVSDTAPISPNGQGSAYLGINASTLTSDLAEAMDLPSNQEGVLVDQVQSGGPADEAGLRGSYKQTTIEGQDVMVGGDVIISIDDKTVDTIDDLVSVLGEYDPGDDVILTILRDGDQMELEATLGAR